MRASTFTTYVNAELDPGIQSQVSRQEKLFVDSYGRISRAAEQATRATAGLVGGRGTAGMGLNRDLTTRVSALTDVSRASVQATSTSNRLAAAIATERRETELASRSQNVLARNLQTTATALTVVQGPLGPLAGRVTAAARALEQLTGFRVGLVGVGAALVGLARVTNTYQTLESRLRPFYKTQQESNAALNDVIGIAQRTSAALEPIADLYIRLTNATRAYGISAQRVSSVTELASKAAAISGGTRETQRAGLVQFGQAIGSNRLGGDELRSVLENIPVLALKIAEGFQKADGSIGVAIGDLKKLAEQGSLTTPEVLAALERSGASINEMFSKIPLTLGRAVQGFTNSLTVFAGRAGETTGIVTKLAESIQLVGNNLRAITSIAVGFGAAFALNPAIKAFETLAGRISTTATLAQAAARGGAGSRVTLLNSPAARAGRATLDVDQAAQVATDARLLSERANAVASGRALEEKAIRATVAAQNADGRVSAAVAEQKVAQAASVVRARRAELDAMVAVKLERESEVRAFERAGPLIQQNPNVISEDQRSNYLAKNQQGLTRAQVAYSGATVKAQAAAGGLADAEHALALATTEATTTRLTANQAARAGLTRMEQLATASIATANAQKEAAAATLLANDAEVALTSTSRVAAAAQAAFGRATTLAGRALTLTKTAFGGLTSVLLSGNFLIGAAVTAFTLFATATDHAKEAVEGFAGGQDALRARLGLTTQSLATQTEQAKQLREELGKAEVARAKTQLGGTRTQLANTLRFASGNIDVAGRFGLSDIAELRAIANRVSTGTTRGGDQERIYKIRDRQQAAFAPSRVGGFFNNDPSQLADQILGLKASAINLKDATAALTAKVAPAGGKPRPTPQAASDLVAQARLDSLNGDNTVTERAAAQKRVAYAALDDKFKPFMQAGVVQGDQVDAYRKGAQLIEDQYNKTIELGRAQKLNATNEKRALGERVTDLRRADREAAQTATDQATGKRDSALQGLEERAPEISRQDYLNARLEILRTYDQEIDAIKGRDGASHTADAQAVKDAGAVAAARRSITETYQQQTAADLLRLNGQDDEAAALERTLQLRQQIGDAALKLYPQLLQQERSEQHINSLLESRNRITASITGAVDDARNGFQRLLEDAPNGAAKAGLAYVKSLQATFARISATKLTEKLFAGTDEKVRAMLQGKSSADIAIAGFGTSVSQASTTVLQFVAALKTGTAALNQSPLGDGIDTGQPSSIFSTGLGADGKSGGFDLASLTSASAGAIINKLGLGASGGSQQSFPTITGGDDDEVTVVGQRKRSLGASLGGLIGGGKKKKGGAVGTFDALFGKVGSNADSELHKIFAPAGGGKSILGLGDTTFFSKLGSAVGKGFDGAATGSAIAGLGKAVGIKLNSTGAQVGGALGGLTGIPGGKIIGSIVGGIAGNLLSKPKYGTASVGVDQYGNATGTLASGQGGAQKKAAVGDAKSVGDALSSIAGALGASLTGDPNLTIGTYKGKYRVSTTGYTGKLKNGKSGVVDFGSDEQAAITFAIQTAVSRSVISGISQASINILKSGQDLDTAIQKAVKIESIPKQLLQLTDPVRYAVTTLNDSFKDTISVLKEAGATSQQFAQAQELYDRQRADAIKQATENATGAITSFLNDMVGGSSSPLNKLDTYRQADSQLDSFRADIAANKTVDQDKLLAAAKNFEDASQTLNGSNSSFFTDFNGLRDLLNKAVGNYSTGGTDLPGSPFAADTSVQTLLGKLQDSGAANTQQQTAALAQKLDQVIAAIGDIGYAGSTAGGVSGTALRLLPGVKYA